MSTDDCYARYKRVKVVNVFLAVSSVRALMLRHPKVVMPNCELPNDIRFENLNGLLRSRCCWINHTIDFCLSYDSDFVVRFLISAHEATYNRFVESETSSEGVTRNHIALVSGWPTGRGWRF
jgi:hypothetical protein